MEQGLIICGFAGVGKSTMAKQVPGVIDLESTPFLKDWETYVRVAQHMANQGYIVLLSCHGELREELQKKCVNYYLAMPEWNCKEEYIERYKNRGNTEAFIDMMDKKWDEFNLLYQDEQLIALSEGEYLYGALLEYGIITNLSGGIK